MKIFSRIFEFFKKVQKSLFHFFVNFLKNPTVIGTGKKSLLQDASINYLVTWVSWRPANNYARWFYYNKVLALTV